MKSLGNIICTFFIRPIITKILYDTMMIIIMMNTEAVNSKGENFFSFEVTSFILQVNSIELEKGLLAGERITIFYI